MRKGKLKIRGEMRRREEREKGELGERGEELLLRSLIRIGGKKKPNMFEEDQGRMGESKDE